MGPVLAEVTLVEPPAVSPIPQILASLCTGCGKCIAVCHTQALRPGDGPVPVVVAEQCDYCAVCEAVCPTGAIRCPFEIRYGAATRVGRHTKRR